MIVEIGHYALVLALGLALVQGSLPLWGAARGDPGLMALARTTALGQLLFLTVAFGALIHAFATSDFSVVNVAANSHSGKPLIYKIAASWGNHEGSLVLWVWILALYGAGVALFGRNLPAPFRARVLAVQGLIGVGFLAFMLLTSNPFLRLDVPPPRRPGLQPDPAGPGAGRAPADAVRRLCRLLDGLRVRDRRADRGPGRRQLGALGAALDARRLVRAELRHRARQLLGLLRARLGRLVVLGPGRERVLHAVARRHRAARIPRSSSRSARASRAGPSCSRSWPSRSRCSAPSWCARAS